MMQQIQRGEQQSEQPFMQYSPQPFNPTQLFQPTPQSATSDVFTTPPQVMTPKLELPNQGKDAVWARETYGPLITKVYSAQGAATAVNYIDAYINETFTDELNQDKFTQGESNALYNYLMQIRSELENELGRQTKAPANQKTIIPQSSPYKAPRPKAEAAAAAAAAATPEVMLALPKKQMKEYNTWNEVRALSQKEIEQSLKDRKIEYDPSDQTMALKSKLWKFISGQKDAQKEEKTPNESRKTKDSGTRETSRTSINPIQNTAKYVKETRYLRSFKKMRVSLLNGLESYKLDELKQIYKSEMKRRETGKGFSKTRKHKRTKGGVFRTTKWKR